jgi:hypothetical protein
MKEVAWSAQSDTSAGFFAALEFVDLDDFNAQADVWYRGLAGDRRYPEQSTLSVSVAFAERKRLGVSDCRLFGMPSGVYRVCSGGVSKAYAAAIPLSFGPVIPNTSCSSRGPSALLRGFLGKIGSACSVCPDHRTGAARLSLMREQTLHFPDYRNVLRLQDL